jgi:glycosyltransferase involved in cell wall biosynthesis
VDNFYDKSGPEFRTREYFYEGLPVFVIERNSYGLKTAELYYSLDDSFSNLFREYLEKVNPDIVCVHHLNPTYAWMQIKMSKERELPLILMYHTPAMTCLHGDMLYIGKKVCDGRIDYRRCLFCVQSKYRIPNFVARLWSNVPLGLSRILAQTLERSKWKSPIATWLQLPWLCRRWIDHFVAVAQWVYEVLLVNDIPEERITLCRHGITENPEITKKKKDNKTLTVGFLGRIHIHKGLDILIKAFRLIPPKYSEIKLLIYGLSQSNNKYDERYYLSLRKKSRSDKRIAWKGLLRQEERYQALSELDALIIPSRWLETGPLVLLEAWAAGVPVVGSRLGGLAELIEDDKGGLLFESENPRELANIIIRLYKDPDLLDRIKAGIPRIRRVEEMADELERLYQKIKEGRV